MISINMLSKELGKLLTKGKRSLAVAESCTGGMIAAALTEVAGSSEYFGYGVVSYSNEAKMKLLQVSEATLDAYGAVSSQTAMEMAVGVRNLAAADFALSVTGIAGPGGATETKPVGLVYLGFSSSKGTIWIARQFEGTRQEIRTATVEAALVLALENLSKME